MRVSTASEIALIDAATIATGVPGIELMERAGTAMAEVVLDFLSEQSNGHQHTAGCSHDDPGGVLVICGKGNNGGDGLVVARCLAEEDCSVSVMLLAEPSELSPDSRTNFELLSRDVSVYIPGAGAWTDAFLELVETTTVVVDAIFGTGIVRPLQGPYIELVRNINDAGVPCLALDIPTGVSGDDGGVESVAVAADMTVTIGLPKRGLLLAPGREFSGDIEVVDIGFSEDVCAKHTPDVFWLQRSDYLAMLPARFAVSHKYKFGTLLAVAGSRAFGGAATLLGMGALRSGAGLVSQMVPCGLETSLRVVLPEVLTNPVPETDSGTIAPVADDVFCAASEGVQALALGPGLGEHTETDTWICDLLATWTRPLVLDADGLNAFARQGRQPQWGSEQVILTPHVGEFGRLVGLSSAEVRERRFELVAEYAQRWQAVLMLKGAPSLIGLPDGSVFINASGDDSLARAGSGDVLTGLLGGLLAQGLPAAQAALLGAYVHGLAGTVAARGQSTRSVLVREVATAIGVVFEEMEKEASAVAELREKIWPVNPE